MGISPKFYSFYLLFPKIKRKRFTFLYKHPANIRLDEDFFKMSWSRRIPSPCSYIFRRHLQDVLIKADILSLVILFQISSRRFQDVFKTSTRCLAKMSSRRHKKMFSIHFWNVFKMPSICIIKLNCSCEHGFKTFSRLIQHVFGLYCQDDYLWKDLPWPHFWEIYD